MIEGLFLNEELLEALGTAGSFRGANLSFGAVI